MSKPTPRPPLALLAAAHATLGGTNAELGALLSVSKRTVVRWYAKESPLDRNLLEKLARLVHPKQPALATEIADAMGTTLEYLGIVTPKPPPLPAPPPPPPDPTPPPDAIDGVVCVAAEAMDASPRPVRGALLAACVRARKLGYTLETLEQALTPAPRRRRSSP